jgi:tetratricopeptide (TPR) repeat protein
MDKVLQELLSQAPQALITIGIIVLVIYILREYRKIRQENEQSIRDIVNAKLGEIMSSIQSEISRLDIISKDQERKLSEVNEKYIEFTSAIDEKDAQINKLYSEAQDKLNVLREAIPVADEFSARDLLGMAQGNDNLQAKSELCERILIHGDSTAKELEIAGDMMRNSNRYSLAMRLYEKAHELDPERVSPYVELLSLQAELDYKVRKEALTKAKELALEKPQKSSFARVSNALIDLDRYEELSNFSDDFISILGQRNPDLKALALRNKAVAKRQIGDIESAIEAFEQAFSIQPEDENTLKPYLGLLEEQGRDNEYLQIARKLIDIDPADVNYYRIYVAALLKQGEYEKAGEWIGKTDNLNKSQMDNAILESYARKIEAAANNAINADS